MKKLSIILRLSVFALFLMAGSANAITLTWDVDHSNFWPGWGNGSGDDLKDATGTPDFISGTAEITGGYLTNLTFEIKAKAYLGLWDILMPADLFIDANADGTWDYVVDLITANFTVGDHNLYSINQPLNGSEYLMSAMPGYGYREDHPIGFEGGALVDNVTFSGWPSKPQDTTTSVYASFAFGEDDIHLWDSSFIIGWTVQCANDVVYEELPNPVPEPATVLLFSSGLIGLTGLRRKFRKK